MKKVLSVLLVVVIILSFAACGSKVGGVYYNEGSGQTITLESGKAIWTEFGMIFNGTYKVSGKEITLNISGGELTEDVVFTGTVDGDNITLTGGSLSSEGEVFVKQL